MSQSVKDIQINKAISLFNEGNVKKSLKEAVVAKKKYPNEPFIYNLPPRISVTPKPFI